MTFLCEMTTDEGVTCLGLEGRLDSATAGDLEQQVLPMFARAGERVVIDMAHLDFVSSAGLRVVLMAAKRAKKSGGTLILCGLSKEVRGVFEVSGFLKILDVKVDRHEAKQALVAQGNL